MVMKDIGKSTFTEYKLIMKKLMLKLFSND